MPNILITEQIVDSDLSSPVSMPPKAGISLPAAARLNLQMN